MKAVRGMLAFLCGMIASQARAVDFELRGYLDVRAIVPSGETSYLAGGLGKVRYGDETSTPGLRLSDITGEGRAQITPALSATVVLHSDPYDGPALDMLEAYVRYRPVSTNSWRWSVKAGAFFPPVSLENTEIGWTSYWTITPSAINSWVGDELRIMGGEGKVEWRDDATTVSLSGAAFGWNDPAGVTIADRGWALDDRPEGLFENARQPDATAILFGAPTPLEAQLFEEIDHRVGWYANLSIEQKGIGSIQIMRYDNRGDPAAQSGAGQFAWDTHFWSAGLQTSYDDFTLLMQGMTGYTSIEPAADYLSETDFKAAYALLGWEHDNWRFALRGDLFQTRQYNPGIPLPTSEDGHAFTAAATWLPKDWLRLTGEFISVDSTRQQRAVVGLDPHQTDNTFQLLGRIYY